MLHSGCFDSEKIKEEKSIIDTLYLLRALLSMVHNLDKKQMLEFSELFASNLSMIESIIDKKYWKYVDLIIYMLEIKKVTSLKEAIERIDLYVYIEKIDEIMNIATKYICDTIKFKSSKIENAIARAVSDSSILKQNSYFKNAVITLELKNAMIEKQDVTIEQILTDVFSMK